MAETSYEDRYRAWLGSLRGLTGGAGNLVTWQDRRFDFAYRIGRLLTIPTGQAEPVSGPVLYGIHLEGVGLAYVGQTRQAERRLRDLPVGESHHVANTVPPELWERIVVVQWPMLVEGLTTAERAAVREMGWETCGLAIEYAMQLHTSPPLNGRRRTGSGVWALRRPERSRSRGALHSSAITGLQAAVGEAWQELSTVPPPTDGDPVSVTPAGRAVFPTRLLSR